MLKKFIISKRFGNIAFVVVLILGLYLRFYQYLMGRSLWEDEAAFALNFFDKNYIDLLTPLDNFQMAPILFTFGVKFCTSVLGFGERAFRLFPFLLSLFSFPLAYFTILELTKNRVVALTGFFLFAVNLALIYFSSELKPYTVDVSAWVVLVFLTITQYGPVVHNRKMFLIIAGTISILCSNTTIVTMVCIVCYWLHNWNQNRAVSKEYKQVILVWAAIFSLNYMLFLFFNPYVGNMKIDWAFAFCPTDVLSIDFANFITTRMHEFFFGFLLYVSESYGFGYVFLFIIFIAIRYIVLKKQYVLIVLHVYRY